MVETAVTNIVRGTVATDNPLAALNEVVVEGLELFADWATGFSPFFNEWFQCCSCNLGRVGIIFAVYPVLCGFLECSRNCIVGYQLCQQNNDALFHLLIAHGHTETELTEVLEQRIVESRTLSLVVGRIGCRRNGRRVDGRTTRCIGYHLTVAVELGNQLHVGRLATTRTCTRELEQRLGKLTVLRTLLDVNKVLLRSNFLYHVVPVLHLLHHVGCINIERNHDERLLALLARANVGTVAATETVEHVDLNAELHAFELLRSKDIHGCAVKSGFLFLIQYERADCCMRTTVGTLVALDTVLRIPYGNKCCDTTLLVSGRTILPCAVYGIILDKVGNLEQISVLSIYRANDFLDESRSIIVVIALNREVSPCRIDSQLLVFTATVNGSIVLVDDVLSFLAV